MEYSMVLEILAAYFGGLCFIATFWKRFVSNHEIPPGGSLGVPKESFIQFRRRIHER